MTAGAAAVGDAAARANASKEVEPDASVTDVELYRLGSLRHVVATDARGRVRVYRESGRLLGSVDAGRPILAVRVGADTVRLGWRLLGVCCLYLYIYLV